MKNMLYTALLFVGILSGGIFKAQSADRIDELKSKKEVLKLSVQLAKDKIELEEAKKDYAEEYEDAKEATREADKAGERFKSTKISIKMKKAPAPQQKN
jgi:hypothetical protein